MEDGLRDQVAIVTGASRGIGRAIAIALAGCGMRLVLAARSAGELAQTAACCARTGARTVEVPLDLREPGAPEHLVRTAVRTFGALHVLVNNAGLFVGARADAADLADWDRVLDTNLRSVLQLTRWALPEIERSGCGAIVNIASLSALAGYRGGAVYCATKSGLVAFTQSVFEDVREHGIKVSAILPGYVNTDMISDLDLPRDRTVQPDDVSRAVLFVLSSPPTACPVEIVIRPQWVRYP